jgi:peptide/nickel transport system permease protein
MRDRLKPIAMYTVTAWAILTINFLLPRAMPGDPLLALLDTDSELFVLDEDVRAELAHYYGLDRPLPEQYISYLANVATGDLGWSIRWNVPVAQLIRERLPWTLLLVVPSLALASIVAMLAGTHSGWVRGSTTDRLLLIIFTAVRTVPVFFVGILAILVFSVRLNWFPLSGGTTPFSTTFGLWRRVVDILHHWTLPAMVLTAEMIGGRFLLMRNSMVTVLGEDYMLVARAKGLPEHTVKYQYGLRNAVLPFFTVFSAQLAFAVAGAVFIETLFAYPGMGRMMFDAVSVRDYPVLEGTFLIIALSVLTVNLATDLAYRWLDPRVREA